MQSTPRTIGNQSRPKLWLVGLIVLAAAAIFVADLLLPPSIGPAVLYLLVVVLALRARQPWFAMVVAGGCTCLAIAGLAGPFARGLLPGAVLPETVVNRLLILAAIWTVAGALTDRHIAERITALLAAVVESSDDSIVSLDLGGNVSNWNRGAAAMYGYTEAEMIGTSILRIVPPQWREDTERMLNHEVVWSAKDGRPIDVSLTVSPILNTAREIVGISTIGQDISESKRNEESLRIWAEELRETTRESVRRKKEAEEANRAKSQFLANMSHELRTPLNAIIGYSEMLQEDVAALGQPSMAVDLDRIRVAGKHLLKLINDVLDLSKVEFGKMDIFIESFEIAPFIEEVASTVKPLVEENGNSLAVDCDPEIGEMRSDRTKVRQCLFNLLSNASKFTNHGKIRLKISRATQGVRSWIDFEVTDTGIGISKEQLEKVFDAFVQAESSTSRKYGGTGLGLTLTKGFCELLGGQLFVQSEEGRGSTFVVRLPAEGGNPEWDSVAGQVSDATVPAGGSP
jgi:PAS domain S-box-containing protein